MTPCLLYAVSSLARIRDEIRVGGYSQHLSLDEHWMMDVVHREVMVKAASPMDGPA